MKPYRQWLKPTSYEAMASLGGSFYSDDIADYYLTPWDLGYGPFVKFDHDFVGRAALEKMAAQPAAQEGHAGLERRRCRRARSDRCSATDGDIAKYIDLPLANYATLPYDKVVSDGKTVGLSTYTGYNFNERAMVSLAIVDNEHSEPGTEVTLVWGEERARHDEADRRAPRAGEDPRDGAPAPISEVARVAYRPQAQLA